MALSRILLGVHYPSDVVFGVALGAAVARLALWVDGDRVSASGRYGGSNE